MNNIGTNNSSDNLPAVPTTKYDKLNRQKSQARKRPKNIEIQHVAGTVLSPDNSHLKQTKPPVHTHEREFKRQKMSQNKVDDHLLNSNDLAEDQKDFLEFLKENEQNIADHIVLNYTSDSDPMPDLSDISREVSSEENSPNYTPTNEKGQTANNKEDFQQLISPYNSRIDIYNAELDTSADSSGTTSTSILSTLSALSTSSDEAMEAKPLNFDSFPDLNIEDSSKEEVQELEAEHQKNLGSPISEQSKNDLWVNHVLNTHDSDAATLILNTSRGNTSGQSHEIPFPLDFESFRNIEIDTKELEDYMKEAKENQEGIEKNESLANSMVEKYSALTESEHINTHGIPKALLKKVFFIALTVPLDDISGQVLINLKENENKERFLIHKEPITNKLKAVYNLSPREILGTGSLGKIIAIRDLILGEELAMKVVSTNKYSYAISALALKSEYEVLKFINKPREGINKKPITGVEGTPYLFMDVDGQLGLLKRKGVPILNYLEDRNLIKQQISIDSIFNDLAQGVKDLLDIDVIQSDIKVLNICLFENKKTGKIEAKHIDFGGAKLPGNLNHEWGSFTFLPDQDKELMSALETLAKAFPVATVKIKMIHMKQMVYCLGKAMQYISEKLGDTRYTPIITKMLNERTAERATIEEVLEFLAKMEDRINY